MKPASGQTPALVLLEKEGVAYTLHSHEYDPEASRKGLQAAESLGVPPERVFKTLMLWVDKDRPACAVIRSDHKLNLKAAAATLGGKSAAMMAPPDAERLTAYKTGGISPFGQKKTRARPSGQTRAGTGADFRQCRSQRPAMRNRP